jgi:hypothetical protein
MQATHEANQLIDAFARPSQLRIPAGGDGPGRGFPFLGKRKPSYGLELPIGASVTEFKRGFFVERSSVIYVLKTSVKQWIRIDRLLKLFRN